MPRLGLTVTIDRDFAAIALVCRLDSSENLYPRLSMGFDRHALRDVLFSLICLDLS
jgi:hypothetical protein